MITLLPNQLYRDPLGNVTVFKPFNFREELTRLYWEDNLKKRIALGERILAGGAAGAWTFTNNTRTYLQNGTFDIDTDTWLMALFLSTSNLGAATTTYAGVTNEHANGNGYTTGGNATALTLSGTTTTTVDCTDESWTASGGSIIARFACIYESGGNVLCYCLLDSTPADVTITTSNSLNIVIHASGVYTLA